MSDPSPADPTATYAALGRFIERRAPYENAVFPSFGDTADDDDAVLNQPDDTLPEGATDRRKIAEAGPYKGFNKINPSTMKSECDLKPSDFLSFDFGDGVEQTVTKAIRIHYKHKRKADGKDCNAYIVVMWTGDSH